MEATLAACLTIRYLCKMNAGKDQTTDTDRWLPISLILTALVLAVAGFILFHKFYHDDAYISLRYVHNFLDGQGLVWNPGESVEGYSNFLWVLLVGLLGRFGIDLVLATKLLGTLCLLGCSYSVFRICRVWHSSTPNVSAVAVLIVLSSLPMIVWSIGGLEPVLFALLLLLGLWLVNRIPGEGTRAAILAGILFALLSMTRPDGPLYLLCGVIWLAFHSRRSLPILLLTFLLFFGAFLLWRYSYYGDWLPNPAYVKGTVTLSNLWRGLSYLRDYAISLPYLLPLTIASLIWLRARKVWAPRYSLLLIVIVGHLAYITIVGGDHMPAFRFMVPIIPLSAIVIAETVGNFMVTADGFRRLAPSLAILSLVTLQILFPPEITARAKHEDGAAFLGRIVGEYISANFPKGSLIALNTAGSTPYYAPEHRFIDMLGLNDRTIAKRKNPPRVARWQDVPGHEKGDGKYVMKRRPDYIIAGGAAGYAVTMGWFLTEYELAKDPKFERSYSAQMVLIPVRQYDGYELYEESESGEMGFAFYRRIQP